MRHFMWLLVAAAAIGLAGCNENEIGAPQASAPIVASSFHLPPGAACSTEIDTYETVVKGDLSTGNVEQKVYDQIQHEMARAAAACSAGNGGQAHAIVAASKEKHGYRA